MRETVRAYAEIYGDLGLFTALEISLRAIARGFESLSLRHFEPKIVDFGLFFFRFCLIFGVRSPLSRKMYLAAFLLSITFLQGSARQLQGWSKTPCF